MLSILAKQWITMFSSRMRAPVASARRWAHRHRAFRDGFDRWHVNAFISSLSAALHGTVLLFLTGLIVHLFSRDIVIFGLVLGVTFLAVVFYAASTVAPLYDGTCPTATPLLIHGRLAYFGILRGLTCWSGSRIGDPELGISSPLRGKPPFDSDIIIDARDDAERDIKILAMMVSEFPAGHDVDTALDAVGGLDIQRHHLDGRNLITMRSQARNRLESLARDAKSAFDAAEIARSLRSSIYIETTIGNPPWDAFDTTIRALKSIRTHDVFALSVALHQLQLQQQMQAELDTYGPNPRIPQDPRPPLRSQISTYRIHYPRGEYEGLQQLRRQQNRELRALLELVGPTARWNIQIGLIRFPLAFK